MSAVQAITTTGGHTVLGEAAVRQLQASLQGELLLPNDDRYEETRKVWNGMVDKRPALIARCAGVADVSAAVTFAREHTLLVSVRGGGHSVAGKAVCNGGLMIDLSRMRGIQADPVTRTARVEGGAILGDLDRATQAFGLATTAGVVTHTGVAGLTLGGGVGRLAHKYGLACDNLLSVDIVTAEGRVLRASATENPDLFWGVRGGGGNFGIVTAFEFRLHHWDRGREIVTNHRVHLVLDLVKARHLASGQRLGALVCDLLFVASYGTLDPTDLHSV